MDGDPLPLLRGARVGLRGWRADDVPALFALQSDPAGMRFWSYPPLTDLDQAKAVFERNERGAHAGDCLPWAIMRGGDDRLIGTCTLFALDRINRRALLGYALSREHWGNGYAQEAVRLALGFAFGALGLHRVEADVDPRNTASILLLERIGFAREGVLRERWRVGDDVQDSAIYGLLAREFALQEARKD